MADTDIARIRKELGYTQAEMAAKLHIAYSTYSSYEHGVVKVTPPQILRAARKLPRPADRDAIAAKYANTPTHEIAQGWCDRLGIQGATALARAFGIAPSAASRWFRVEGAPQLSPKRIEQYERIVHAIESGERKLGRVSAPRGRPVSKR